MESCFPGCYITSYLFHHHPERVIKKKKVRFTNIPEVNDEQAGPGVVRIKLILSKKELQELVEKGVSVHDMASHLQSKQSTKGVDMSDGDEDKCRRRWKPELESIAEVN
ncbi:hypothetical protein V6N11_020989 [Hibiscus sabdariffa]|uniref:Uncharacterized protein n=1 Tax=Hibiscus sabdariffa TaxID=183260 RepID=A0ABR1ZZ95_9ROSI